MSSFNPLEWADYEVEASFELDALSKVEPDRDSISFSVISLSEWEVVTTSDATFLGVLWVSLAVDEGFHIHGGKYSGTRLSPTH